MFIYLLIQKYFLNTHCRQSFFSTIQSKRVSDNTWTNEISRYKSQDQVQICGKRQRASERRVNESDFSFESS